MMFQFNFEEGRSRCSSFEEGPFVKYFNSFIKSMIEQKMGTEAFGVETTNSIIRAPKLGILEVETFDLQ